MLGEIMEFVGVRFQREPETRRFKRGNSKHFAADFEDEVVFPLHLLGGAGEGEAKLAELVDVHG